MNDDSLPLDEGLEAGASLELNDVSANVASGGGVSCGGCGSSDIQDFGFDGFSLLYCMACGRYSSDGAPWTY